MSESSRYYLGRCLSFIVMRKELQSYIIALIHLGKKKNNYM